jgi:hypothetical protein
MLDITGKGHNASNMPSVATGPTRKIPGTNMNGRVEHDYDYDGTDDHFPANDANDLSFGNSSADSPFSISVWFEPVSLAYKPLVHKDNSSTDVEYVLGFASDSGLCFRLMDLNSSNYKRLSDSMYIKNNLTANPWVHVCVTYDGSGGTNSMPPHMCLYINGVDRSAYSTPTGTYTAMHNSAGALRIGKRLFADTKYCDGRIDDVRIYNTNLSSSAVSALYQHTCPTNNVEVR